MIKKIGLFLIVMVGACSLHAGQQSRCINGNIVCLHPVVSIVLLQREQQKNKVRMDQIELQQKAVKALRSGRKQFIPWENMPQVPIVSSFNILATGSSGSSVGFGDFEKALGSEFERGRVSFVIEDLPKTLIRAAQRGGLRRAIPGAFALEGLRRYQRKD